MSDIHSIGGIKRRGSRGRRSEAAEIDDTRETDLEQNEPADATIDEQEEMGCLENWEPHYGFYEQIARFAAYSTRPDLIRALYGLQAASGAAGLFQPQWIEKAKDTTLSVDTITRGLFRS